MPYTPWLETGRNRIPNPKMLSLTGWATTAAGWSITSTPEGIQVDATTGGGPALFPNANISAVAGELYGASWDISVPAGFPTITVRATVYDYSSGGGIISERVVQIEPGDSATIKAVANRATAGATGIRTILYLDSSGVPGVRFIVKNNALATVAAIGDTIADYYDGDSQDTDILRYFWTSAVGNSESIREERSFNYPPAPRGSETIRPQDLLVEYRDRDLVRQGSIPIEDLQLKIQPVFNGVGSWSVTLPAEHRAVPYLRAPGAGIIVTNLLTGETLLSGSTSKPSKKATSADPKGMATIAGLSDDRLLWDALAFPQPSNANPTTQTAANDVRTAKASTLMRLYVNANIGPGSPVGRRGSSLRNKLTLGPDALLGAVTTRRPRFDVLGDLLNGIALETGLGFRVVQVGSNLQFQVYQPTNRAASIRLDVHNGTLQEQTVETAPPEVTRVVVAGQGQGTERQIFQFDTTDSLQGEDDWGFIIEEFKDQRNTSDTAELESSAMERLNEAGFTKVAVKATPSNEDTMIFMTDFFLGDQVAVVIDGQEQPNSIITEAAIVVDNTGLHTAVAIGDVYDFDSSSALRQTVEDTQKRLDNLERNVEIGSIGWDDVQGKPTNYPTTWSLVSGKPTTFTPSSHTHPWSQITDPLVNMGGDVDASALPGSYATGVVIHTAGAGWPMSIGTVLNVRHSGYRQFQIFTDRSNPPRSWFRTANGDSAWRPFVEYSTVGHTHSADEIVSGLINIARLPYLSNNSSNGRVYLGTDPANPVSGTSNFLSISPDSDTGTAPFRFFRNNSTVVLSIENDGEITGDAKMDASRLSKGTVPAARLPAASDTAIGAVERATTAEVLAGTDLTRYVTPFTLNAASPMRRGTTTQMNAATSQYWDFWYNTTDDKVYVGNKSGGWRRYSGTVLSAETGWATTSGSTLAGRTAVFTLPTVLESNETILVQIDPSVSTSGYNFLGATGLIRDPTNTKINVRFMQIMSLKTQPMPVLWQIVPI